MPIIVEDGSVVPNANSYVTEAEVEAAADELGITAWGTYTGDTEAVPIRVSQWIDRFYGRRFIGIKEGGRSQSMEWPRVFWDGQYVTADGLYVVLGTHKQLIPDGTIPIELKRAVIAGCFEEIKVPFGLSPIQPVSSAKSRVKVGPVDVQYAALSTSYVNNQDKVAAVIDQYLSSLLTLPSSNPNWYFR